MIIYKELVERMKKKGITSFAVRKAANKKTLSGYEGFISESTFVKLNNNRPVELGVIEKILNELNIDEIRLVKNSENNFEIVIPDKIQIEKEISNEE